ncbi:FAB1 1-phosphatidylinositol 3-phosphate 5-kinase FAB1 [Candida maltosa Xu316]
MHFPRLQSINSSTTSSVVNVNAQAAVEVDSSQSDKNISDSKKRQHTESKNKNKSLQNKISSIFNNLPNDIELSDDSASDSDTTRNDSTEPTLAAEQGTIGYTENPSDSNLSTMSKLNNQFQYDLSSRYSESIAKSSPIKAERKVGATFSTSLGQSPTISSFHALQNKDLTAAKKRASHLSSVLLDNARTIIHQNIGAVASSASSIVGSKKRKKKPKKISENPLKNGGIPRKYWMNDAFVSDCLNCFRPFTAFRRKHHCRFCGQIFCSDCTLFISYNQHKDERNNAVDSNKRPYNDKLRVCKPCYSDVIIYLSDDSSSSESEAEKEISVIEEVDLSKTKAEDLLVPNHPLSRIRSMSMSSHRESSSNGSVSRKPSLRDGKFFESVSNSNSPSRSNGSNALFVYPDESIKVHPKQAPRMAIPTTRTGESVEIPLMRHSLMNPSILKTTEMGYGSNVNVSPNHPSQQQQSQQLQLPLPLQHGHNTPHHHHHNSHQHQHHHHHHHHHHNRGANGGGVGGSANMSDSQSSSNAWIRNHLSPSLANTNVLASRSLDNLSGTYANFMNRNPSFKFRVLSGNNNKDITRYGRESSQEPGDLSILEHDLDHTIGQSDERDDFDDDEDEDDDDDDNDEENIRGSENEEDEHAMSLYASLNDSHGYGSTPLTHKPPPIRTHTSVVVPTLGEFPIMKSGFPHQFGNNPLLNNIFTANTIGLNSDGQQKQPSEAETIRSKARAHASLQRMRSRRQGKSTRNVSILTQNNLRLPSLESPSHTSGYTNSLTPITSPSSPPLPAANHSHTSTGSDVVSSSSVIHDPDMSPIGPRISASTAIENYHSVNRNDYFGTSSDRLINSEEQELNSWKDDAIIDNKDKLYKDTLDFVLRQSLKDCEIEEDLDQWMTVLSNSLSFIDGLKLTDTLDIRQYVKIKKILGGKINQTGVVDGLFMTKNIDSKKMSSTITNPRIALLMFPVEYLKQKEQFISLRIIHAQQSVYITNLVSRLVSLEPDIIVVGDSVCGLAEKLLEEAGVTVISNVKPQVIERISRYTNADIFQSVNDLFFKKGKLGSCEKFSVKRFKFENFIKTFIFFTGCDIQSGFTISLRGGDEELLNSVKYAAETLMPGYLNARFEKSFFDNLSLHYIKGDGENRKNIEIENQLKEVCSQVNEADQVVKTCEISLESTEVVNYVKLFNERRLSLSPSIEYSLPKPLINVVSSYFNFYNFYQINKKIQNLETVENIDENWLEDLKINYKVDELPSKEIDLLRIIKLASESHLKLLVNAYQRRARVWSNCMRYPSYQLYPIFHRSIHVLHSTVSIKHATPCSGPGIVVIDYYTDNDKCFGLFLDQAFHESSKQCNECGELFVDHYKSYVHGDAKIDLIMEKYDIQASNQGKNQRVMWSYCKECNFMTPIIAMSDETYYLSIGKFFELSFYGENVVGGCKHDFFKSYVKCFGFNNLVIRLEYSKIDNYEIIVPKKQLEFVSNVDIRLKLDAYKSIKSKSENFFESVLKRLNRVKLDTFDKAEDGMLKIEELKKKLQTDSGNIYNQLQKIYDSISPTNYLQLNIILQDLQKLGILWDNEFNEFEKTYLPSENEVNRITQFHLRKFLMDRYNDKDVEMVDMGAASNDSKHSKNEKVKDESIVEEEEDESEVDPLTVSKEIDTSKDSIKEVDAVNISKDDDDEDDDSRVIPPPEFKPKKPRAPSINDKISDSNIETKMFPQKTLYEQNSNISERISKWNETAETGDENIINRLTHRKSDSSLKSIINVLPTQKNKVIDLANFFDKMYYDQISLEFSKQRERELRKKSKIKAQPIFDSKPIVEIYNKIEDVVGPDDDKKKNIIKSVADEGIIKESPPKELQQQQGQNQQLAPMQIPNKQLDIPEKQSLLKSLTNFWADRSATLWDPLEYPLESHEHTFADSDVIVREDEPSSLVAFCLSSNDYKQKIKNAFELNEMSDDSNDNDNTDNNNNNNDNKVEETVKDNDKKDTNYESDAAGSGSGGNANANSLGNSFGLLDTKKKSEQFEKIEKKFKKKLGNKQNQNNPLERILIKNESNHLKYQFIDGNTNLSCKIFYSEQFEALRKACGNDESFIQSLSRCVKWQSNGGKSGSSFLKTLDNRYILKELSKSELESFVSIAPFYFKYINQSMFNTLTTAIAKIFGFYQVQIKNNTNGKIFKMDFLVMENLFYNYKTSRIFDLKGSMRNRHVQQTGKENEVLLDENMIEYIYESPVFVDQQSKKLLRGCLFNDTSFLSAMDVMDYSLVIGIDDQSEDKKLYIGIIDWLRTFTWDKKVENWVKGNIGGNKKDPTIVTPRQYKNRFKEAMDRYILEVPDIYFI